MGKKIPRNIKASKFPMNMHINTLCPTRNFKVESNFVDRLQGSCAYEKKTNPKTTPGLTGGRIKKNIQCNPATCWLCVGYNKPHCYMYKYVPFVDVWGFAVVDDTYRVVVVMVVAAVVGGGT